LHDRAHFYRLAAKQMRQVLIDHGRKKNAVKRGERPLQVTISPDLGVYEDRQDFEQLEDALTELDAKAPEVARIIELRFFAGLQDREVAEVLGISFAKVRRHWQFGRAFLLDRLTRRADPAAGSK
jgi:RNA polymerase sigma factor (TIGR02999 family)